MRLAGGLAWGVGQLPSGVGCRVGAGLGQLAYRVLAGRRGVVRTNLGLAFGAELSPATRDRLARSTFRHLGITAVECCRLFFGRAPGLLDRVRFRGLEHLDQARAGGRGVLCLSGHLGNWELGAAAVASQLGIPVNVVARPLDDPFLEALLGRGRARAGVRLISKRMAVRGVQAVLAEGSNVAIMLDQNAGRRGVFVPFFGRAASTSRSLAVLALRTGAPVLPVFIHRLPDGGHEVAFEPPVQIPRTGQRERDVEVSTARFNEAIERQVRAHPEQWFWVHRRWKTRPAPSPEPQPPGRPRLTGALTVLTGTLAPPAGAAPEASGPAAATPTTPAPPPDVGFLWGRLTVEEESPDGPWTPLVGVEVTAHPYSATLLAEAERIRASARDSSRQYDTAVTRLRQALGLAEPAASLPRRVTDPAGLFVFADLPVGEWLVVATRIAPYGGERGKAADRRAGGARQRFLAPSSGTARREAEVWLVRVRVEPGVRARLILTDRSRWLVGPVP